MTRIVQTLTTLLFFFALLSGIAYAGDSAPQVTIDQFKGTWKLEGTAQRIDGEVNAEKQTWNFGSDGILNSVAQDRRADGVITLAVPYKLDNGLLLVQRAGSKTRWNKFRIIKMTDSEMTIKGGIEGFMFFKRKE